VPRSHGSPQEGHSGPVWVLSSLSVDKESPLVRPGET
jgi:hypothetical protein